MNRRTFVGLCCGVVLPASSGCNGNWEEGGEVSPQLDFFAQVEPTDTGWELTVRARNTHDWDVSVHDITVLAFSDTGEEVCRKEVGDLVQHEDPNRTVTMVCKSFPAIITGTAAESPCDGARIELLYWVGSEEQRSADLPGDVKVWESTYRECNEPLPPKWVLEEFSTVDPKDPPSKTED